MVVTLSLGNPMAGAKGKTNFQMANSLQLYPCHGNVINIIQRQFQDGQFAPGQDCQRENEREGVLSVVSFKVLEVDDDSSRNWRVSKPLEGLGSDLDEPSFQ